MSMIEITSSVNTDLVCICVPVKNGSKTIFDTLQSLASQTYRNIEIVVCDNLSSDNTKQVVEDFIKVCDFSVRYMMNSTAGSAEQNWNFLLENLNTKANYIALYHADDLYEPTIISKELDLIKSTGVGAVFTLSRLIDEFGKDISTKYKHKSQLAPEIQGKCSFDYQDLINYTLRHYNFIKAPTFFFRKDILKSYEVFFQYEFKTSADLDFWLRIAKDYKIAIVEEPLHLYRISNTQGTYTLLRGKEKPADYFSVMDYHVSLNNVDAEAINIYSAFKSMDLVMCSLNLSKNGKKAEAREYLNNAISLKNIRYLVKIPNGIKNFSFGLTLWIALKFGMERKLLKVIGH